MRNKYMIMTLYGSEGVILSFIDPSPDSDMAFDLNITQLSKQFEMKQNEMIEKIQTYEDAFGWYVLSVTRLKTEEITKA